MSAPVLFRVDAGPGIGLGHLHRCLALAEGLGRAGASSQFLTQSTGDVPARVAAAGWPATPLDLASEPAGGDRDRAQVTALADTRGARLVVVDSYASTAAYLGALRASGFRVIFIDDLAREPLPAHVVVNGGAQAPALPYRSSTGDTRFLLGPAYALLRSELREPPRPRRGAVRQVLVTVGGDDPGNFTPALIELVSRAKGEFEIVVAVGPFNRGLESIESSAKRTPRVVTIVRASMGLRELIANADLVISAAGQTLYELAAMGAPAIAFELAGNQSGSLDALAAAGVVKSAGRANDPAFGGRLTTLVEGLVADGDERVRLGAAGRRLIDGHGADRVAAVVLETA